uniref:Putative secreted peptide n=1 Tax=Anopheles braziliensis TaxID=58242 RepID=A0A2M3ZPH0_9DIPT
MLLTTVVSVWVASACWSTSVVLLSSALLSSFITKIEFVGEWERVFVGEGCGTVGLGSGFGTGISWMNVLQQHWK